MEEMLLVEPLGKSRRRWDSNIKLALKEVDFVIGT
jgi:hypothetical protein